MQTSDPISTAAPESRALGPAARLVTEAHDRVRRLYAPDIGRLRQELATPALLLDLDALRANLALMATGMAGVTTTLRAHVKVHKSPHIARMQIEHGAIGVGCATVWEAIVMVRAGIRDVFVINEVVGSEKTRALGPKRLGIAFRGNLHRISDADYQQIERLLKQQAAVPA